MSENPAQFGGVSGFRLSHLDKEVSAELARVLRSLMKTPM
jgi:hypothetical protein